jgi:hypothetical protein
VAGYEWNHGEDRTQAGGFRITLAETAGGVHVRYALLVRRLRVFTLKPKALVVRCYENGNITVAEESWEG